MEVMKRCWEKKETNNKAGVNRAFELESVELNFFPPFIWVSSCLSLGTCNTCVYACVGVCMYCSPITAILSVRHNTTG